MCLSIGSNIAFFREGLPLNAIIGVFGNNINILQCFLITCLNLFATSLIWLMNTSFCSCRFLVVFLIEFAFFG